HPVPVPELSEARVRACCRFCGYTHFKIEHSTSIVVTLSITSPKCTKDPLAPNFRTRGWMCGRDTDSSARRRVAKPNSITATACPGRNHDRHRDEELLHRSGTRRGPVPL